MRRLVPRIENHEARVEKRRKLRENRRAVVIDQFLSHPKCTKELRNMLSSRSNSKRKYGLAKAWVAGWKRGKDPLMPGEARRLEQVQDRRAQKAFEYSMTSAGLVNPR